MESASYAIAQSKGLRVGYRDLIVNYARFSKNGSPTNNLLSTSYGGDFSRDSKRERPEIFAESDKRNLWRDNAEDQKRILGEDLKTIYIQPTTSEWLQRSAIVELKSLTYAEIVQEALLHLNFKENVQALEWRTSESRLVWLKCRGMPLNTWALSTLKKIGDLWGNFVTLDHETLSESSYDVGRMMIVTESKTKIDEWINIVVRGKNYKLKIWEEECNDPFAEKPIKEMVGYSYSVNEVVPKSCHSNCKDNYLRDKDEKAKGEDFKPLSSSKEEDGAQLEFDVSKQARMEDDMAKEAAELENLNCAETVRLENIMEKVQLPRVINTTKLNEETKHANAITGEDLVQIPRATGSYPEDFSGEVQESQEVESFANGANIREVNGLKHLSHPDDGGDRRC
ncbi:hypothetical protein Vadar_027199 [Vaccinium darrowii]|uniref:Uncharacterized protein n=1 Tax=Vaccinium darrowii TaxID=229202 RepID=A0ACB7ZM54_9ERIC|nr:hypothetical protein Vadar_027199 [Vaccinium darrowii]